MFCLVIASAMLLLKSSATAQSSPWDLTGPELKIAGSNNNVTASWPISPFDFVLGTASSLPAAGWWTAMSFSQNVAGDEMTVTVPVTNALQFFRLEGPSSVPIFQFAIFYTVDLEIAPSAPKTVTGRVHCNSNLYATPNGTSLAFQSPVTAANMIYETQSPLDPTVRSPGTVIYQAGRRSGVSLMTLPIGTNSDPNAVYEILKPPPVAGDTDPALGAQRYYNKADIIIRVTDNGVTATSGSTNLFATPVILPVGTVTSHTNKFYNGRELKGVNVIDIDLSTLKAWADSSTGAAASMWTLYGREPNSCYVLDQRTVPAGTEPGVRLNNGAQLPNGGLTLATPDPLYVHGDFNTKDSTGTSSGSDTAHTKPSSLVADAITILSVNWSDAANATSSQGNFKNASSTTVNAAFLAGIVQTTTNSYSGGVENFPRFLEDWSGDTLTYNGSMVVLFYSQIATGPLKGTNIYYTPPIRNWAFDNNFMRQIKLPPATPPVGVIASSN